MAAGLPGFGLSGVFFIISALLMVPMEIVSTLRGRSSLERWGQVLRSAGIALSILVGVELTYAGLHIALTQLSSSTAGAHGGGGGGGGAAQAHARTVNVVHVLPVLPILATIGLVAIVIVSAKAAELISDWRRKPIVSGDRSASAHPELRSHGERRHTPRPRRDPVDGRPSRGRVQPHLIDHERGIGELQHPLELASDTPG
jgi:hypothetical protein